MVKTHFHFLGLALCCLLIGCKKSENPVTTTPVAATNQSSKSVTPKEIVAKLHWIGKRQLAADTNSHDLMAIWNVAEGLKLEAQTLDKLAAAPWRYPQTNQSPAIDLQTHLRSLLDDVLQEESYIEVGYATNQPGELVCAIKLNEERASFWRTNLAAVLENLVKGRLQNSKTGNGWSFEKQGGFGYVELARVGGWTVLALNGERTSSSEEFALKKTVEDRIQNGGSPFFTNSFTNFWLAADLDVACTARALGLSLKAPFEIPKLVLRVSGNGEFVKTRCEMNFSKPLTLDLEPWNIPTNLMHGDLSTFSAVRGLKPWLGALPFWDRLQLKEVPNQVCFWGIPGLPARTFFAIPSADASNSVKRITDLVLAKGGAFFATNELGGFRKSTQFEGLEWQGIPYLYPFLKSEETKDEKYIFGGTVVVSGDESPPAMAAVQGLFSRTNLVYYDREFTGGQIEQWIYAGQFIRYASGLPQLPQEGVGLKWLKAIEPITGSSATDITQTRPDQLTFTRTSGSGFTAIELNLLVDWLESPGFPWGLHTFPIQPALVR